MYAFIILLLISVKLLLNLSQATMDIDKLLIDNNKNRFTPQSREKICNSGIFSLIQNERLTAHLMSKHNLPYKQNLRSLFIELS